MTNYAGMHWPNGPEDYERIMALPSPLLLMLSTEARYHYDKVRKAGKTVIWRGLPRIGKRPAELKYSASKAAKEALNLWDEQPHYGTEYFVPFNELDLNFERGDDDNDFEGTKERFHLLSSFLWAAHVALRRLLPEGTQLLFSPWTPDHGDIENVESWRGAANQCDGIVVHGYEDAGRIVERIEWYLKEFPDKFIVLGEWNAPDPASVLEALRELSAREPRFMGATYFAWHWHNAPAHWPRHYNVDENPDLYQLFKEVNTMALTRAEVIDLICRKADEHGIDRAEFLGGAIAESALRVDAARWGIWPDVSFGLFQQTVAFADEGNQQNTPENVAYIQNLYNNPEHSADVAARKYKYWRHNPDVPAVQAWCAYNWPGSYHFHEQNPNYGNYRDGLAEAARILGYTPPVVSPSNARTYGQDVPYDLVHQRNDWSCAVRSTYAALWAMAQEGHGEAVTYGDEGPRDVYEWMVPRYDSPAVGLHNADGSGLVEVLRNHGYDAGRESPTSLAAVQARAGKQPVLIGGRAWNHWVYVRGVEDDGTLILENPAEGFGGIKDQLRDSFDRLGPFTMVWINVPEPAQPQEFQFLFGMMEKAAELGSHIVGTPIENEHYLNDRISIQHTTTGVMIYSVKTGQVHFIEA